MGKNRKWFRNKFAVFPAGVQPIYTADCGLKDLRQHSRSSNGA
jgi:hypothetical protein